MSSALLRFLTDHNQDDAMTKVHPCSRNEYGPSNVAHRISKHTQFSRHILEAGTIDFPHAVISQATFEQGKKIVLLLVWALLIFAASAKRVENDCT